MSRQNILRKRDTINSLLYTSEEDFTVINMFSKIIPETEGVPKKYVSLLHISVK
jgi:hypothetical protein